METLLKLPEVLKRTSLSRANLYARIAAGTFPKPVKTGERAVAWPASRVQAWIDATIAAADMEVAA